MNLLDIKVNMPLLSSQYLKWVSMCIISVTSTAYLIAFIWFVCCIFLKIEMIIRMEHNFARDEKITINKYLLKFFT